MEETVLVSPNNEGKLLKLEIRQKNVHIKKRKVKTWSSQEDEKLVNLYEEYPKRWSLIASLMTDRNENQCLHRYRRLSQLGAHKKIWSAEEDKTILSLIKKVGKNWKLLSQILGTKTGKQIRQRFINKLDPKIKSEEWTPEEDRLILKHYFQIGSRWSQISKKLPGRPENKIKNRFYSYIQKNYDLKYSVMEVDPKVEEPQQLEGGKVSEKVLNEKSMNFGSSEEKEQKVKEGKFPSLKQFADLKMQDIQNHDFLNQIVSNQKLDLRSLIRIDDEGQDLNQYKSIREIVSDNDINNDNDFFYLSA